jgi:DNA-binding transcriptional LysR family regulator
MLELRRLRLLRELHQRGTIAAVADALRFTPSAVSQQLAQLEREAGVPLLERSGRSVRLTDAAVVLSGHAEALLERTALAEADLAAAAGTVAGRARIACFQSVAVRIALPAMEIVAREAPRLRCELVESEPEQSLPALAVGDLDLVLGDEWTHQPWRLPTGVERADLFRDPVRLVLPSGHPAVREHPRAVPIRAFIADAWATGHTGMGWAEMTERACRSLGGFDPDIRHRTNDADVTLALVARGHAVSLLPDLIIPGDDARLAVRDIEEGSVSRTIFAATRITDRARPSTIALLRAIRSVVEER